METQKEKKRDFAVELESRAELGNITLSNGGNRENVLIQGTIGYFRKAEFAEGVVLEVVGTSGVLRIDLKEEEVHKRTQTKGTP